MDRRAFLTTTASATGLAVLTAVPTSGLATKPRPRVGLPTVEPVEANRLVRGFGVCAHPNFNTATYQHTTAWVERLAGTNASYFRGMYTPNLPSVRFATTEARRLGVGWLATVAPENWSVTGAQLIARLEHLRDNAADVVIAIEGINEPNHERSGGPPPADWPQRTVAIQKVIWDFVQATPALAHVQVIGPSLHASVSTVHEDHLRLGHLGCQNYFDYAGLHRYFGGRYPDHLVDERLGWIKEAYGDRPTWVTETGYTNCVANTKQHKPVPENVSAAYGPLCLLEFAIRGCRSTRYELLDDPDENAKDVVESNFGLWRTPSLDPGTWTEKPEATVMRDFLSFLEDPGPHYTPAPVQLRVTAPDNVKNLVVGKRNGSATLLLWQNTAIFDPNSQTAITVPSASVGVKTASGFRAVNVPAGEVVRLRL
ncbi:MAG: hypothetical protein H0V49_06425 [Nocardioidaceae bacterium]|nr:hypothetical protein [Nocardioidaceae bacterium]